MKNITIKRQGTSPKIILDSENNFIEFEGKCYPENTFEFFEPILTWLSEYFKTTQEETTIVNMKLTYFNSATTQSLFDIFDIFQEAGHKNLQINWYCENNSKNALRDFEDFSDEFEELNIQAISYEVKR